MSRAEPSSSGRSPLPPHIRPSASRHNSSSSTSSSLRHPHAQQREYVPSTLDTGSQPGPSGLGERWAFEHAEHPHVEAEVDDDDAGSEADWIAAKEQDDARRPAWRRASPRWLYPFVSGATLALGMGIAPRSEIYVNLACLAHPPQVPSSLSFLDPGIGGLKLYSFHSLYAESMVRTTTSIGIGNSTVPQPDISPADRWFLKAQRDMYEHQWSRHHTEVPHTSPADTGEQPSKPEQPPYREIDPKTCKRDPTVQAAATRLSMIMTLALGCLAALTTGYWGQMSDKIGRTKIMGIMMTGLLLNDISFILVATFPHLAPGGYRALLIGPICEGLLGGISTLTATVNAYVSDVTPDGSRAAVFARMGGIIMLGFAFGPVLGSAVIKATGNIMTPFYLNVVIQTIYITCIFFVLPESLSKEARTILRKKSMVAIDAQKRKDTLAREWEDETPAVERDDPFAAGQSGWSRRFSTGATSSRRQKRLVGAIRRAFRRGTAFLQPLGVFMPVPKEDGGRDWNMTVTGAALFTMSLMMGVYQVKTQYTLYSFGWTSAQLGPYMSLLGFSRGFVMLVLLPLAMRLAKPYFIPAPSPDPSSSSFSDVSSATVRPNTESSPLIPTAPPAIKPRRPATLDLWTARLSLAWESLMYFLLVLNLPEIPFIAISALVTLAAGSNPAANSLALSFIPNSREAGRLFGGVAVLHALGSTLLGPLLFGSLFSATVGSFTTAVWVLAGLVQAVSLGFMCFVRIPREKSEGEEERGRGRVVKGSRK